MKTQFLLTLFFLVLFKLGFGFQPVSLSGVVSNADNGKGISDISIVVEEIKTGTITNQTGDYLLYLKEGNYKISFDGKGFQKKEVKVELIDDKELKIELTPESKPQSKGKKKRENE